MSRILCLRRFFSPYDDVSAYFRVYLSFRPAASLFYRRCLSRRRSSRDCQFARRIFSRGFVYHPLTFSSDTFYSACASFFRCLSAHDFPLPPRTIYREYLLFPREVLHPSVTSVLELVRAVTPPPPPPFPSRQLLAPHTTTRYATPLQTAATRSQRLRRLPER